MEPHPVRFTDLAVTKLDIGAAEREILSTSCRVQNNLPNDLPVVVEVLTGKPAATLVDEGGHSVKVDASVLNLGGVAGGSTTLDSISGELRANEPVVLGYKIADVTLQRAPTKLEASTFWVGSKSYDLTTIRVSGKVAGGVLGTTADGKPVYRYETWVSLPSDLYRYVEEVKYDLQHPTNPHPPLTSRKPEKFFVSVKQWGCIRTGKLAITFKGRDSEGLPLLWDTTYDQCKMLGVQ